MYYVKSRLLNILNKTNTKIYARKCIIKAVNSKEASSFLNTHHIQGAIKGAIKIGLFYNDQLVSLLVMGKLRKCLGSSSNPNSYELLRYCNKLNTCVIGGASKLLKYFETNYHPRMVISYADRRWSNGNLYTKLGFNEPTYSKPNYFYTKDYKNRENRFKYRKDILVKQGYDKTLTEKQIMQQRGYKRIYDCGTLKFTKIYK